MFILLAIALSHCLLRLFLLIRRWNIRQLQRGEKESIYNPRNHAIPVILARDEEIGISGSTADDDNDDDNGREMEAAQTIAPPPPAYGLWRGSVVFSFPFCGEKHS